MSTQTEAQRLADALDCHEHIGMSKAAAELRRLESANKELREALAEQPAPVQEPEWYHFVRRGEDFFVPYKGQAPANATRLYTAPQAQPARDFVWLTLEEIKELKNLPGANRERTAIEMAFAVRNKLMEKNI